MTSRWIALVVRATLRLAPTAALFLVSRTSVAAPGDAPRATSEPPKPEPPKPDAVKREPVDEVASIGIQRLPPSAYPEPTVRGIYGGSMWMSLYGLQWPYMPMMNGVPNTRIGISGYIWVDNSYEKITAGNANDQSTTQWIQQGRAVLRATPTWNNRDWFAQGQVEVVANNDQSQNHPVVVDTDDLWLRLGKWNVFDVQVGRFQAWELYHFGMGLDLNTFERIGASSRNNTAPAIYGVTYTWDRPSGVGNAAVHLYPTKFLRIEALGQIGNASGQNALATRPAVMLDFGWLKLRGAAEYQIINDQVEGRLAERKQRGGGGSFQIVLDPHVEFGGNAAQGLVDVTDERGGIDPNQSVTTTSFGGFANGRIIEDLVVGVGVNHTQQVNLHKNAMTGVADEATHLQTFGAVQYLLWKQVFIKAVVAYAKADFTPGFDTTTAPFANKMVSGRLRLLYLF